MLQRFAAVDGDGLAFAHGHILRVLTARWCEMEVAAGAHFKLATAAIGVLGHERATTDDRPVERMTLVMGDLGRAPLTARVRPSLRCRA